MKLNNVIVTVTIPFLGHLGTLPFINFLSLYGPGKLEKIIGSPNTVNIKFEFNEEYKAKSFIDKLTKVFNPTFLSHETKIVNKFDNDWEEYEHVLKNHDWYYSFSDDPRYYHGGEAVERRINELKKKLSNNKTNTKKATQLYKKYAPKVK